jgi:hypothetical protein
MKIKDGMVSCRHEKPALEFEGFVYLILRISGDIYFLALFDRAEQRNHITGGGRDPGAERTRGLHPNSFTLGRGWGGTIYERNCRTSWLNSGR